MRSLGVHAHRLDHMQKPRGSVLVFLPAIVWRASQCGWLKIGKTELGNDIWEKPSGGSRQIVRSGVEPLVPVKSLRNVLHIKDRAPA